MPYHYTDPTRESDPNALPDVEVFHYEPGIGSGNLSPPEFRQLSPVNLDAEGSGWFYAFGFPGRLWDGDPTGPFETEAEALAAARGVTS